jgi:UDP-N-acetyl-D-mannosaminuronic acid transferase (WecB/TagA/CpsF family)
VTSFHTLASRELAADGTKSLGASEGVAADAADELTRKEPSLRVTVHWPSFGFEQDREEHDAVLESVRDAKPR